MKRVITEQHYLNEYKGHNSHLTEVDRFKKAVQELAIDFEPNYYAVYRPQLSKISYKTVDEFMLNTLSRFELLGFKGSLDAVYYTVEEDRYKQSMHMNMLIKGSGVNRLNLSTAMKRSDKEIGYLEPISNRQNVAIYVNKHIAKKGIHLGLQGLVDTEQALKETEDKSVDGYELFDNHPNKEKHLMQKFIMQYKYGWANKSPQVAKV